MAKIWTDDGRYIYLTVQGIEYRFIMKKAERGCRSYANMPAVSDFRNGDSCWTTRNYFKIPCYQCRLALSWEVITTGIRRNGGSRNINWREFFHRFQLELSRALGLERRYTSAEFSRFLALDLALESRWFRAVIGVNNRIKGGRNSRKYIILISGMIISGQPRYISARLSVWEVTTGWFLVRNVVRASVTKVTWITISKKHDLTGQTEKLKQKRCGFTCLPVNTTQQVRLKIQ